MNHTDGVHFVLTRRSESFDRSHADTSKFILLCFPLDGHTYLPIILFTNYVQTFNRLPNQIF